MFELKVSQRISTSASKDSLNFPSELENRMLHRDDCSDLRPLLSMLVLAMRNPSSFLRVAVSNRRSHPVCGHRYLCLSTSKLRLWVKASRKTPTYSIRAGWNGGSSCFEVLRRVNQPWPPSGQHLSLLLVPATNSAREEVTNTAPLLRLDHQQGTCILFGSSIALKAPFGRRSDRSRRATRAGIQAVVRVESETRNHSGH